MTNKKIKNNKKYSIDGWAVYCMVDILKFIKSETEKNTKQFSKNEFLEIVKTYNFVIKYLLNLKNSDYIKKNNDIYYNDELSDAWKKLLSKMKIKIDGNNKKDENEK